MNHTGRILVSMLCLIGSNAGAADRADLEGTSIIGSRELPKVTYIVPWKKPLPGDLVGRPVSSLLDEALAPVDRDVFRREVEYHGLVSGARAGDMTRAERK